MTTIHTASKVAAALACVVMSASAAAAADVVDTLRASGQFDRTVEALDDAGLTETLRGSGPFTVLAPLDEAYDDMADASRDRLLSPANRDYLRTTLGYHVIPDQQLTGDDLHNGVLNEYATLDGAVIIMHDTRNGLQVGDMTITRPNIRADNGIIHGVDRVILKSPTTIRE
ncbi:fasciclin domain-containing protein [Marinivivus vitaminiproducens]|uniref:fasciclin domain-containing protein n=1 Tax=Marinivivus vitaminiproducens TaxID=3035935 RepID=UPI0027A9FAE0|nr:fasciclin domain-containing protein [Geminicoccaceae bacterium SCSIO 64248]